MKLKFLCTAGLGALGLILLFTVTEHIGITSSGWLIKLMSSTISIDGQIDDPWKKYVLVELTAIWLIFVLLHVMQYFPTWRELPKPAPFGLYAILGITLIAFFSDILGIYSLPLYFFDEDGIFEWFTAICLITSGLLMLANAWRLKKTERSLALKSLCILGGVGILFVGMEEISWGQRIFGWETTGIFAEHNDQLETNFHNLYNETFWLPIAMIIIATVVVLGSTGWMHRAVSKISKDLQLLLPQSGQFLYAAVLLVVTVNFNEMFEVLFSACIVYYCAMIWHQSSEALASNNLKLHLPVSQISQHSYR